MNLEKFLPEVRILNYAGNATHAIVLLPKRQITFEVVFKPVVLGPTHTYLVFRNNLTLVELIPVRGIGGKGLVAISHVCAHDTPKLTLTGRRSPILTGQRCPSSRPRTSYPSAARKPCHWSRRRRRSPARYACTIVATSEPWFGCFERHELADIRSSSPRSASATRMARSTARLIDSVCPHAVCCSMGFISVARN